VIYNKGAVGVFEWSVVDTPDSVPSQIKELLNPCNLGAGITKIAVSNDFSPIWAIVRRGDRNGLDKGGAQLSLYMTPDIGQTWTDIPYRNLASAQSGTENGTLVWDMAIAPDNPKIIVVACSNIELRQIKQEIWLSTDQGSHWENTLWTPPGDSTSQLISAMAISIDYGNRKILAGTRDGTGKNTGSLFMTKLTGFGGWNVQDTSGNPPSNNPIAGDILAAKFSPNFDKDHTIIVLYTNGTAGQEGTWLAIGTHDTSKNITHFQQATSHVEIKNSDADAGNSARPDEIITANIEIPFDFSGESVDRRHVYVSVDAVDRVRDTSPNRGIYRVEKDRIFTLMDNTSTFGFVEAVNHPRRVSSIAYFGVCSIGKLLVGEALGFASTRTVPTWFTDSPTIYPIPCWYPALKPTTGAGCGATERILSGIANGYGNAQVAWSPAGEMAYIATCSTSLGPWAVPTIQGGAITPERQWPAGYMRVEPNDESAFGMTRNNGETWNQLGLINTEMSKLTDVAVAPDCTTIYLASIGCGGERQQTYSVWRSTVNPNVAAPLPANRRWERVLLQIYPARSESADSLALLRLIDSCTDKPDGEIIASGLMGTRDLAWSPDFGDYWAHIKIGDVLQDFCFETSTSMYAMSPSGMVQKISYSGTSWDPRLPLISTKFRQAHTISSYPAGHVLVGAGMTDEGTNCLAAYCSNMNSDKPVFSLLAPKRTQITGNIHVAFDPDFRNNGFIYINSEPGKPRGLGGSVYRNSVKNVSDWIKANMINGGVAYGANQLQHNVVNHFGLIIAKTGNPQPALYSVHDRINTSQRRFNSGVCRTLTPRDTLTKPGMKWDCLQIYNPLSTEGVVFSLEPSSLKSCGCCTLDTNTGLYAIDDNYYANNQNVEISLDGIAAVRERGMLWTFMDIDVKRGPTCPSEGIAPQVTQLPSVLERAIKAQQIKEIKQKELQKIVVFTEGKYDRSIIESAWSKLNGGSDCPYTIVECDTTIGGASGGSGGAPQLVKTLEGTMRVFGSKIIGIFDRDSEGIKQFKVLSKNKNFVNWRGREDILAFENGNTYAMLLPIPPNREICARCENLSIEFMFADHVLEKKTKDGRGLQLESPDIRMEIRIKGRPVPEELFDSSKMDIPDSLLKECRQIGSGKDVFAYEIVPSLSSTEFQPFKTLFQLIEEIIK